MHYLQMTMLPFCVGSLAVGKKRCFPGTEYDYCPGVWRIGYFIFAAGTSGVQLDGLCDKAILSGKVEFGLGPDGLVE